ncbi:hypothetical protein SAMN05444172_1613 [Burkholderia sp. GAS332]|nr:hypothetical protein SAMN05444172_1613 [Burkholderia sp. GAS332]
MNTKTAHAHIWAKVREFDGDAVLYAFRFDNGRTKFGKSTNIMSRCGDHLAHGITGCTGVTVVRVHPQALNAAEYMMLQHVAARLKRLASEVFVSSDSEASDERLIREAVQACAIGAPTAPVSKHEAWRITHDAEVERQRTLTDEQKREYLANIKRYAPKPAPTPAPKRTLMRMLFDLISGPKP